MEELLSGLEHAANTPAKQRATKINVIVGGISSHAFEKGLSAAQLRKIIDIVILSNTLDQASRLSLIRSFYPATSVPDDIVVNIVASLGHGNAKPSHSVQAALLRWLIMVYDVLESPKVLSQLYAVLFNLLDTMALRAPLCHILSLITRRRHVRPYRIQSLMELTRQFGGSEAPLVGLLRVYKDYYPDVIVRDAVAGRAKVFTHPDEEWRLRLVEIQELNVTSVNITELQNGAFKSSRRTRTSQRRTRSSVLPDVRTSNALETSITLEEIDDVESFVEKLEKIEPPNQLVSVIGDPLLQKLMQLRSEDDYTKRIDLWLFAFFEDKLSDPDDSASQILELLQAILEYARYTKTLPAACVAYLKSILLSWNGITGRDTILGLLTYLPADMDNTFNVLLSDIFQPMEDSLLAEDDNSSHIILLQFYTTLLDRWTIHALAQSSRVEKIAVKIQGLIDHAMILTLTISQSIDVQYAHSTILSFYKSVLAILANAELRLNTRIRITTPPAQVVYSLQFTSSLSTLSELCEILASYKRSFEVAMASKGERGANLDAQSYPKDYVNHFNGYLMDICNCLWRARALHTGDPNAHGCMIDPNVVAALTSYIEAIGDLTLPSLFSISTSPNLCLLAITYLRELEDSKVDEIIKRHAGPVSQASLRQLDIDGGLKLSWQDYRLGVLQYLEGTGVAGVGDLMYSTMKNLMTARNQGK